MELNPHHAGWFHFPLIWDHCSRGEWEQMLERAKRLGRKSEAAAALTEQKPFSIIDNAKAITMRDGKQERVV